MQKQSQGPAQEPTMVPGLIKGVLQGMCLTIDVWFHRTFGTRYISGGFAGVLVLFVVIACCPHQDTRPLFWFMVVYGVMWLVALVCMWVRRWRGKDTLHSGYTGQPYLWSLVPGWTEETVKHMEALVVIAIGVAIRCLNHLLGDYLIVAASVVFLRGLLLAARQRNQAIEMNDMMVEQRLIAEKFNSMQR